MTSQPGPDGTRALDANARALVIEVRRGLADAADPARAEPMRAYMKSAMPFRGVPAPGVKRICRAVFAAHRLAEREGWVAAVRELYDRAEFREERYAAIALTGHRDYRAWQDVEALELYDHLIVEGAWWDYVDELAIRRVGPILRTHREGAAQVLSTWAYDKDIWRRRAAILAQVLAGERTDPELLAACVAPSLARPEFFLRKAIGWALRAYAKVEPEWVRAYVAEHERELSPLSRREARKHLG